MEISYSSISSNNQSTSEIQIQNSMQGKMQVSSVDLEGFRAGKMFQGEIIDVKGTQVSIRLDNGQVLQARLEEGTNLAVGEKITFEVALNTGTKLTIKPADLSFNLNPVLQKALQEANLPITERNLQIVNAMINEGLSINKQSLSKVIKQIHMNEFMDVGTLVKMHKLGIEPTKENIKQFENYKNYEHRIVKDIDTVSNQISKITNEVATENKNVALSMQLKLLDLIHFSVDYEVVTDRNNNFNQVENNTFLYTEEEVLDQTSDKDNLLTTKDQPKDEINVATQEKNLTSALQKDSINTLTSSIFKEQNATIEPDKSNHMLQNEQFETKSLVIREVPSQDINGILNKEQIVELAEKLTALGADKSIIQLVKEGNITPKEFLKLVKNLLGNPINFEDGLKLFQSKEYAEIFKHALKEQWLIKPEELNEANKINKYYRQLDEQTKHLSSILETAGKENSTLMESITNIRNNLNFMEEINQNVTYMQIPIQFSNEEAHSDLYVYTNKKNLENNDGNLSVLLHLDMEMLGTTDIYINMRGNHVNAKFSLEDEKAIEIVKDNLEQLISRLEEKGYKAEASVTTVEKEQKFVEDFLEKDKVFTSLKRYAFDVRT